jgi:hypothetical protein
MVSPAWLRSDHRNGGVDDHEDHPPVNKFRFLEFNGISVYTANYLMCRLNYLLVPSRLIVVAQFLGSRTLLPVILDYLQDEALRRINGQSEACSDDFW